MATYKTALRDQLRTVRSAHATEVGKAWHPFSEPLIESLFPLKNNIIGSYLPIGSEADPAALILRLAYHEPTVALPRLIDRGATMTFATWHPDDELELANFGFYQPIPSALPVVPDVVLCPLIGYDPHGNRIGQGAGHYDRWFADNPDVLRIGVAWSIQQVNAIQPDPWDIPLDAIITEKDWIVPSLSRIAN